MRFSSRQIKPWVEFRTREFDATNDLRFSYTGRELADEAGDGTYYYRRRFYDAVNGRFINQDPIGFTAGDSNLYRYVGNSPLNHTDPTGLIAEPATGADGLLDMLRRSVEGVPGFEDVEIGLGVDGYEPLGVDAGVLDALNRYDARFSAALDRARVAGLEAIAGYHTIESDSARRNLANWYRYAAADVYQGYFIEAPVLIVKGVVHAVAHPIDTTVGVSQGLWRVANTPIVELVASGREAITEALKDPLRAGTGIGLVAWPTGIFGRAGTKVLSSLGKKLPAGPALATLMERLRRASRKVDDAVPHRGVVPRSNVTVNNRPQAPPISPQKQARHADDWANGVDGNQLTSKAWREGTPFKGQDTKRIWDAGQVVGKKGETKVVTHLAPRKNNIHGHPKEGNAH